MTIIGMLLMVTAITILGGHYVGHGRAGRALSSASLPPGLGPVPSPTRVLATSRAGTTARGLGTSSRVVADNRVVVDKRAVVSAKRAVVADKPAVVSGKPAVVADRPGVPLTVSVAGHQVQAPVSSNRLNADGSLFVPPDPRAVSWASQDVGPGSAYGTTILVGHVNFAGVSGVFSDLADYRVGQIITVGLADGRTMRYAVAAPPIEVNKDQVGARRQELFDQSHSYGLAGRPKSGRLLLLSCGGVFDNRTGHYESNIFVYALPA